MKALPRIRRLALLILLGLVLLRIGGINVFTAPFLIPEAPMPEGFPAPGKVNEIIVKSYPKYRSASVNGQSAGQNRMFGSLFNHIKENKISMTAPVEITYGDNDPDSMSFLYRSTDLGAAGHDGDVIVSDQESNQVVSIAVRGTYNKERFERCCEKLRTWVEAETEWSVSGTPRYLAYNSPLVPGFLRYGEVQIPIQRVVEVANRKPDESQSHTSLATTSITPS